MVDKYKIVHIIESFGGGVFTYLVDLCNRTKDEFNIVIAYADREQTPDNLKEYFDDKIDLVKLKNASRNINLIKDIRFIFEIKKLVKLNKPSIVHLHSSKAGFAGRMAINCKKTNVYYTPHGYSYVKASKKGLKEKIFYFLETIGAITSACTICVSKSEYDNAPKICKRKIYINNGIDISKPSKTEIKDIDIEKLLIITAGRITEQKNPVMFNKIAMALPDLQFKWVGTGELKGMLTSDNITITGWKEREEVLDEIQKADIFILTSLWEGLSVVLLEALYNGKVCIVTNIPGNFDVILHGQNGFCADTVNEFVNIINNIKDGKYNLKEIANSAHKTVLDKFNSDVMSKQYIDIYNSDLEKKRSLGG